VEAAGNTGAKSVWIDGSQLRRLRVFKRPEDAEHYFDRLRKAGLPES
jgi:hypothetical protein